MNWFQHGSTKKEEDLTLNVTADVEEKIDYWDILALLEETTANYREMLKEADGKIGPSIYKALKQDMELLEFFRSLQK